MARSPAWLGSFALLLLLSTTHASPALELQRKTLLENPGAAYMLISFPSEEYDLSIEITDEGAKIFFQMCTARAATGEPIAVRLMYRLLLDAARRAKLNQYGDVPSHLRKQLKAEYGVDPRTILDDARMQPELPTEDELNRALAVLYPDPATQLQMREGWREKIQRAEAIAAARSKEEL